MPIAPIKQKRVRPLNRLLAVEVFSNPDMSLNEGD
jgi:hypothetical protein